MDELTRGSTTQMSRAEQSRPWFALIALLVAASETLFLCYVFQFGGLDLFFLLHNKPNTLVLTRALQFPLKIVFQGPQDVNVGRGV